MLPVRLGEEPPAPAAAQLNSFLSFSSDRPPKAAGAAGKAGGAPAGAAELGPGRAGGPNPAARAHPGTPGCGFPAPAGGSSCRGGCRRPGSCSCRQHKQGLLAGPWGHQAGSLPRTCPHPSAKPPRLTGAAAGGDQAKKSGRPQHRDVLKEVEAASREEPGKSPKSARTKRGRKARWLRAHRCSRGSCGSPCKKLPRHKRSGRAGHANRSSPVRGRCVLREAEIWGDECFGTGCTCASTAFAKVPSKTDGHAGKQLRLHRHSVETPPAIRRGTSVVSRVVLQR